MVESAQNTKSGCPPQVSEKETGRFVQAVLNQEEDTLQRRSIMRDNCTNLLEEKFNINIMENIPGIFEDV